MNGYFVTRQDPDEIHTELAGNVCQNGVSIADIHIEHCIRQCISYDVRILKDQWTTVTADGKLSAHYENTVLITDGEPEILTVAEGL